MIANSHLYPQLDAFAALAKPGFALMVDAPWGVGKSHALRGWMSQRSDCLYVSLYGAVNGAAIEDALFDALISNDTSLKAPKGVSTFDALGEKWTGIRIDLTGAYRRQAMKSLPRVLIFDDLERAEMSPNQLLGRINQFVEHDPRNVILIAHQEKLRLMSNGAQGDYDSIREKVIGRAIAMTPETETALNACLTELNEQTGGIAAKARAFFGHADTSRKQEAQKFLDREKTIILSAFADSKSQNLRLLRQAVLEFARFHGQVPQDLRKNEAGMKHLLATFIALAIAYHGGNGFKADDLEQKVGWARALWRVNAEQDPQPEKTGIEILQERYQENQHVRLDETVIPGSLARALIDGGYVQDSQISTELRNTAVFTTEYSEAWQTLWWWPKRPEKSVDEALHEVKSQLKSKAFLDPIVILHVGGILLDLADNLIGWDSREKAQKEMLDYIASLEAEQLLAADRPKGGYNQSILEGGSFGLEIKQRASPEFKVIFQSLTDALDRRFWAENQVRVQNLLGLAKTDPEAFAAVIDNVGRREGLPNYAHWPIMTGVDPDMAARAICALPPNQIGQILAPFKNRIQRLEAIATQEQDVKWPSERDWLLRFRAEANLLASTAPNPIRAAQIRTLLRWNLSFLDEV